MPVMSLLADALSMSLPKSSGPVMPPTRRSDRVEEGDAQGAGLHREHLAGGEVRRAGAGRGEEEDHAPEVVRVLASGRPA